MITPRIRGSEDLDNVVIDEAEFLNQMTHENLFPMRSSLDRSVRPATMSSSPREILSGQTSSSFENEVEEVDVCSSSPPPTSSSRNPRARPKRRGFGLNSLLVLLSFSLGGLSPTADAGGVSDIFSALQGLPQIMGHTQHYTLEVDLSDEKWEKYMKKHNRIAVLFYSPVCAYSMGIMPLWDQVAKRMVEQWSRILCRTDCIMLTHGHEDASCTELLCRRCAL